MSAGYRQLDAEGNLKLKGDGAVLLVDEGEACCCEGCPDCNNPSATVEVSMFGVVACTCNTQDNHLASESWEFINVDGSWSVPFQTFFSGTGICQFSGTIFNAVTLRRTNWSDKNCTEYNFGPTEFNDLGFIIDIRRSDCKILRVSISTSVYGVFSFEGEATIGEAINNQRECGPFSSAGMGGIVTVEMNVP